MPSWFQTWWPQLTAAAGGLIFIGLGIADHFVADPKMWGGVDLGFIYGGGAVLGVTSVGSAAGGVAIRAAQTVAAALKP